MKRFQAYLMHLLFFLSLTSHAISKLAKPGCVDTCGNLTIPYPFGISADCAVNQQYIVDCNNLKLYLPALHHVEVLGINMRNYTVTVNMPRFSYNQNPFQKNNSRTRSFDLGGSPFFFSKRHNIFVFEGCGTAAMMDHGSVVTGCSTACHNITLGDRNNCFGINCCQTTIPNYLDSYNINLNCWEEESCGSAFLVDEASYRQERFSDPFIVGNTPVSLLWTLGISDQITCCDYDTPTTRKVNMFNGTAVDTLRCYGPFFADNPYLIDGCKDQDHGIPKLAKPDCVDTCGNVTIPFPFGIGADCAVNHWYIVDCNDSTPYLPALKDLKLLSVDLQNQTVTGSMPWISDCQKPVQNSSQVLSLDLGRSPYFISKSRNIFVFKGCGTAALMTDNGSVVAGCSTACHDVTLEDRNSCFGVGCCQTPIPHYLKSYNINLTGLNEKDGDCGSAFLVDEASFDQARFSYPLNTSFIPISLTWILGGSDQVTCCHDYTHFRFIVDLFNGTLVDTWSCYNLFSSSLSSFQGNPFLRDGCIDDYDSDDPTEECRQCRDNGGHCNRNRILDVDGFLLSQDFTCNHEKRTSLRVILGASISMGILFLVAVSYIFNKWIKKIKEKRERKRFFKRNGGLLLKQQEEADPSLVDKTIHFTSRDLQKATDNFNENRILGRGGQGTVYKGMLVDGRIVAIKKSKIVDESQLQQFINEVVILSQISHRNVVKLLECCLETDVPVLVSEFIPNGTLYDRLHSENDEFFISLNMRLQIATEVAGALAYLHSATSIPIYHRDIKTTNILLDEKFRAKVSDFGTSRLVSIDQTHLTTLVKGTFGYLDPEYFQSSQFTEKSDVYSFGVVLVELLTGERPISLTRFGENRSLATHFMLAMEEGRVMSILDAMVIKEGTRDELLIVANLAMRCLSLNGKYRPTMKEVAVELETIRRSHIPSMVQMNTRPVVYEEEQSMLNYGESSSTFLSFEGFSQ